MGGWRRETVVMDEAQAILLSSLRSFSVSLPAGLSSTRDIDPDSFFSIVAQSIRLLDSSSAFPASLPLSMAGKVGACSDAASALKKLGFRGDLDFFLFLYPSEEDIRNVVRFLVEKLSKKSLGKISTASGDYNQGEVTEKYGHTEGENSSFASVSEEVSLKRSESLKQLEGGTSFPLEEISEIINMIEGLQKTEYLLMEVMNVRSKQLKHLEDERAVLKEAVNMVSNERHLEESYIEELKKRLMARKNELIELEQHWDITRLSSKERKNSLESDFVLSEKLQQIENIELEIENTIAETLKREDEYNKLISELQNQPKTSPRTFFIQRITENTKNSRKQEADIERILKETHELQTESHTIQDRLHRTYAVVKEITSRNAKDDPVRHQAHRLLTSIHQSFADISEMILATDRARKEAADLEAQLSGIRNYALDIEKLEADLKILKGENDLLEQELTRR